MKLESIIVMVTWLKLIGNLSLSIVSPFVLYRMIFKVAEPQRLMIGIVTLIFLRNVVNLTTFILGKWFDIYLLFLTTIPLAGWFCIVWTVCF
jgi:hypothetical protein